MNDVNRALLLVVQYSQSIVIVSHQSLVLVTITTSLIVPEMDFWGKPAVGVKIDQILIQIWHSSASASGHRNFLKDSQSYFAHTVTKPADRLIHLGLHLVGWPVVKISSKCPPPCPVSALSSLLLLLTPKSHTA